MASDITHYIDGQRRPISKGRSSAVFNPATGQQTGTVHLASTADVNEAVAFRRKGGAGLGGHHAAAPFAYP